MLDSASSTLSPLPDVLGKGLVAVSTFGLLSFFCSTSLFFYLTYRLISWRLKSGTNEPPNQFLLLIYNLLLADIQQALAFLLNISSLRNNAIIAGTSTCFAQGWFVSTGDLASSVFILSIALHTFFGVVKNYRLPSGAFYGCIAANWVFVYVMGAIGPLRHGHDFYARASAWCWISERYSIERLWLHYFWIFVAMFTTILIYTLIFLFLQRQRLSASKSLSSATGTSATPLMILYPLIYTVCTAPLAAGRIYALAGHSVSLGYFCAAGTMIACNGWLDVLLYASTRADIVFSEYPPGEETGLETFAFMGKGHRLGTVTTIEAGSRIGRRSGGGTRGSGLGREIGGSVENLYGLDQIGIKGEVSVVVDVLEHGILRHDRGGSASATESSRVRDREENAWDNVSRKSGKSFAT